MTLRTDYVTGDPNPAAALDTTNTQVNTNTAAISTLQTNYASIVQVGLYSALPAASAVPVGSTFTASDRKEQYVSDGTNWNLVLSFGDSNLLVASGGQFALPRIVNNADTLGTGPQVLKLTYFRCQKTQSISAIRCWVGTVAAAATPTHSWMGLWTATEDGALTGRVGLTADTTSLFTGSTEVAKSASFTSSYTTIKEQYYAAGLLVVTSAATPTFAGTFIGVDSECGSGNRWAGQISGLSTPPTTVAAGSVADASSAVQFQLLP